MNYGNRILLKKGNNSKNCVSFSFLSCVFLSHVRESSMITQKPMIRRIIMERYDPEFHSRIRHIFFFCFFFPVIFMERFISTPRRLRFIEFSNSASRARRGGVWRKKNLFEKTNADLLNNLFSLNYGKTVS